MDELHDGSIEIMVDTKSKRIGIILPVPGDDDELVIDLSITQAKSISDSLIKAIDTLTTKAVRELNGKGVIL